MVQIKPAISFEEQVALLQKRGLIIEDLDQALRCLKRINYYRLTAYALSFKKKDMFYPGTTFNLIFRHYELDSKLRNLLMEIIEYVEISFRTHISYLLGHEYGALGYKDPSYFRMLPYHWDFMKDLAKGIAVSRDLFVTHHKNKYNGEFPIWVVVEVLQFSGLSKLFKNLKLADQRTIARTYYEAHHDEISSWLYSLTVVRNRCAHYNRLFNHPLPIKPRFKLKDKKLEIRDNYLFAVIYNLKYLVTDKNYWRDWTTRLAALVEEYSEVDIGLLGFREDWYILLHSK